MGIFVELYLHIIKDNIKYSILLKIAFVVFLASWLVWLWNRRRFYLLSMKLPGPKSLPFLGNALGIGIFGKGHELIQNIRKMGDTYPSPFCLWLGTDFSLVIAEPEDLEVLLLHKASSHKDKRYDLFFPCIGKGLLSASGDLWKKHRQILNPSFRPSSVRQHQQIHNKHARHLIENLNHVCGIGTVVDVAKYSKRCVADIVAEALFELNMEYYKGEKDHALEVTTRATELIHDRMTKFWQETDIMYNFSKESKLLRNIMINYRKIFHTLMKEKIYKYIELNKDVVIAPVVDEFDDNDTKLKTPFGALMKEMMNGKLEEKEVMDEFHNIYNPGMDTTYSQVASFMMVLGMHRDKQKKVWEEVREYYKNDLDADVVSEDLSKLPYLEMCVKELIRLFPTGPIFMRKVTEDIELKRRNITIPKGAFLTISLFILHRNPKYWDSPDSFIPERFSPEVSKKRPHFAYLPFSAGQRNCVAQHFAMDMLKTIAIHLIRNFEFYTDLKMDELTLKTDISVRSAIGYYTQISKRNRDVKYL